MSSEESDGADISAPHGLALRVSSGEQHAIFANTLGKTSAIRGESPLGTGVMGFNGPFAATRAAPKNVGVHGASINGRGGTFTGGAAAVRLLPSGASTHPASGARGDLFVDSGGRLWYSRGGSDWVRLDA